MGSAYLSSYISNSSSRADAALPEVVSTPTYDNTYLNCQYYRQLGACSYLHTMDTKFLLDCLHRSVGCYLFALKSIPLAEKRISECEPIFDAISAGLNDAVNEMLPYVPKMYNADYEYEEDFLYIYFLLNYFFNSDSKSDISCEQILVNYEDTINGFSARFDICKSFFEKDDILFGDAFDQFLLEREERIITMIERETMPEEEWAWRKYISFEALGLLKLASTLTFKTEKNYSQVPESLRQIPSVVFDDNLWRSSQGTPYWAV